MKKLLVIALALSLGGCSIGVLPEWRNPLASKPTLASVESAYGSALTIATGYKALCVKQLIASSCRAVVAKLQKADAYAYGQILVVRAAAKKGSVNVADLLITAKAAVDAFTAVAQEAK